MFGKINDYESPVLDVVEIEAEQFFAGSVGIEKPEEGDTEYWD